MHPFDLVRIARRSTNLSVRGTSASHAALQRLLPTLQRHIVRVTELNSLLRALRRPEATAEAKSDMWEQVKLRGTFCILSMPIAEQ